MEKEIGLDKMTPSDFICEAENFLKSEYYLDKDGSYKVYWDYNDILHTDTLSQIYDLYSDEINCKDDFYRAIENYAFDNSWVDSNDIYGEMIDKVINHFGEEKIMKIYDCTSDELYDYLYDDFIEHFYIDYNVENLTIDNITFQAFISSENNPGFLEDEYFDLRKYQNGVSGYDMCDIKTGELSLQNKDKINFKEVINNLGIDNTQDGISILLQTQGYKLQDLYDDKKVEDSKFLKSLKEEITDYKNILEGSVALVGNMTFDDYLELIFNTDKNIVFPKSIDVGIVDAVNGSGCGLNVELEKEVVIPKENLGIYDKVRFGDRSIYFADDIFGFYTKEVKFKSNNNKIEFKNINIKDIANTIKKNKIIKIQKKIKLKEGNER